MKVSTLRSKGFRFVMLAGPTTQIRHDGPFSVNGKPARLDHVGYIFNVRGWYGKEIPREIVLL